jgi:hypothetical protein
LVLVAAHGDGADLDQQLRPFQILFLQLARGRSVSNRRGFPVPVGQLTSREHGWITTWLLNLFSLAISRPRIAASKNPDWKRLHMIDLSQCARMPLGKAASLYRCLQEACHVVKA